VILHDEYHISSNCSGRSKVIHALEIAAVTTLKKFIQGRETNITVNCIRSKLELRAGADTTQYHIQRNRGNLKKRHPSFSPLLLLHIFDLSVKLLGLALCRSDLLDT